MRLRDVPGRVMALFDSQRLVTLFNAIADAICADKERLCALDGVIGDADHGIAMELGFNAVRQALSKIDVSATGPSALFNLAANSFLNAVGASSGPLYATALMRAGAAVRGKQQLSDGDIVTVMQAMAKGIQDRGKAEPGEKTMVDVWHPASLAVSAAFSTGRSLVDCLDAALSSAKDGAEATKHMIASKGRAARLGERSLGHMDPGAASAVIIIASMRSSLID
jgi:phosphoenolpyruvate---glycerone phosphotransferase subunit DhaL